MTSKQKTAEKVQLNQKDVGAMPPLDHDPETGEMKAGSALEQIMQAPTVEEMVAQNPYMSQYTDERLIAERTARELGLEVTSAVESAGEYVPTMGMITAEICSELMECKSSQYKDEKTGEPSTFTAREVRLLRPSEPAKGQPLHTHRRVPSGTVLFLPMSARLKQLEEDPVGLQFMVQPPPITDDGTAIRKAAKNGHSFHNYNLYKFGVRGAKKAN